MANDHVTDAKNDLRTSIARLKEAEAEVTRRRQAVPPPTFKEDGLLLMEAAAIRAELTAHELLLNHMEAIAVQVDPPTAESGKALADAIRALDEMKQATTALTRFLDLCATLTDKMDEHRREIDRRTNP
ncbi:MAG: hypothetical protein HY725_22360 [Candidatus Rokubacteria bacterium]|nr:hypothetical protein [Candidatus Rokubacteria bacterium]